MTDPVTPRDAATVVLIRDAERGIETFLIRRVEQMAFAAGMTVFPGGGVDDRDAYGDFDWMGPQPQWWAAHFDAAPDRAKSLVCAAVREMFEECGVLLASGADGALADTSLYTRYRTALVDKSTSLAEFLRTESLTLRADHLAPLAHWITPATEKRRYDTRFFVAALPPGQHADDLSTEAQSAAWQRPSDAIAGWQAREHQLMPPTWAQLDYLTHFDTVAEVMAAQPVIAPVTPDSVMVGETATICFDGADRYSAR